MFLKYLNMLIILKRKLVGVNLVLNVLVIYILSYSKLEFILKLFLFIVLSWIEFDCMFYFFKSVKFFNKKVGFIVYYYFGCEYFFLLFYYKFLVCILNVEIINW